jgi:hypothetical protein
MTAIWFSLSVPSIITAQTRLECFGTFIVYMSTVSNVKITFGCVQFTTVKAAFTLVSIFMTGLYIYTYIYIDCLFCLYSFYNNKIG